MKFVLVLLFSAALGLKLSEHELPDCTGTKELAKKNGDQWRCDEFSGQNEACGSRYQEHNGATFQCVVRPAGSGVTNCLTGHRCKVPEVCPAKQLESLGNGFCSSGQIYGSHAWELASSSGGVKGFDTPEYEAWVQTAWKKCLEKDAETVFVSVWKDAGYRCYKATTCGPNGDSGTRSWAPAFSLKPDGYGHCSSGQIYGSHAWELAPSSVGVKEFNTPEYKAWVQAAWGKCLEKDAGTKYVSVWKDAGYRCYKAATCGATDGASSFTRSWAPLFSLKPDGYGHCSSGQIYGSHAWELAPSSVGVKDFNTPEYKAWVQAAWGKCLEKDAGTKYVSVWKDAGYRCYTAATCGATDGASSFTRSWAPAPCGTLTVAQPPQPQAPQAQVCPAKQLESLGNGFCSSGQIYGSHAWELASSSGGIKGFDTPEYEAWVQTAWKKCLEKDAETAFVSVWKDAGYRCYKATTCGPNGDSFTRSWAPAFSLKPDGYGHCSSGQIYGSHAWELAPSSVGVKDFNTPEYKAWVQAAWGKCLEKDAGTKYVSVWKDAGYRCYVAATCGATDGASSFTRSWAPAFSLKPDGYGHCSSGQIYGSHAWELAPSSVGVKDFNTPEYKAWVQAAWGKCLEKDAGTKYVSVWKDAGYRCYTAATCGATDGAGSFTRSWTSAALPC